MSKPVVGSDGHRLTECRRLVIATAKLFFAVAKALNVGVSASMRFPGPRLWLG